MPFSKQHQAAPHPGGFFDTPYHRWRSYKDDIIFIKIKALRLGFIRTSFASSFKYIYSDFQVWSMLPISSKITWNHGHIGIEIFKNS
jgi:hypothetical protein